MGDTDASEARAGAGPADVGGRDQSGRRSACSCYATAVASSLAEPDAGLLEDTFEVVERERDLSGHVAGVLRSPVGIHCRLPCAEQVRVWPDTTSPWL
ncbi:MAG: hypothetical protein AVDCRST_MAG20-2470 [uncultured Acidimicrobiales bacterium]|uniref:Uncharacterized protein n=1 Tax=uncultured Acidimicrobiales bacterium TaxID=310071 RepID=A0A6J4IMU4_9ACTN|nr:MAG: hypothetical protein AVDCRST_MAG20-2470 [uncultured Acidimicrobiales bacterium]